MPGGEVVTLLDALGKAGIRFVLARQETSTAIMTAGAFAARGAPGLLLTTIGPGLANAVNDIADAAQERVPLIVISGVVDHSVRSRFTNQAFDHAALLRPLVKASFEIEADDAGATVARAIALACAEAMGPVHLDLAPGRALLPAKTESPVRMAPVLTPSPAAGVATIADSPSLSRPGTPSAHYRWPRCRAKWCRRRPGKVARTAPTPLITIHKAKGIVPEHHPLVLE